MPFPVPLAEGHDPEVVRRNARALSEHMPYPNACGVALQQARRWWEWQNPGHELPAHLRKRSDENLAIGSYELSLTDSDDEETPLARARSAEAAHRASRRMDMIDQPVEVRSSEEDDDDDANMLVGGQRVVISATLVGRSVALRPPTSPRLGNNFKRYTDAARPAGWDPAIRAQVGPLAAATGIFERLRAAGFEVDVSPELVEAIAARADSPHPEIASKGTVSAARSGQSILLNPVGRFGDSFDAYRTAARPAARDPAVRAQVGPLGAAIGIFERLRAAGFEVDASPELIEAATVAAAAPQEAPSRGTILVTPTTTRNGVRGAAFRQQSRLYGSSFDLYRDLTKGETVWDGAESNVAALVVAPKLIKALSDAGFSVMVDPSLADAMKSLVENAREDTSAGRERVEKLDAALRKEGKSLYEWQKEGIAWLSGKQTAMLLDDPGLGKTIQSIVSLPPGAPTVVVAPATVKGNWKDEFEMWRPEYRAIVLDTKSREPFRWPESGEVVITNYSNLPDPGEYGPPHEGTVLIADEAQDLKNGIENARGRRFKAMAEAVRARNGRTWGLTGTPMENKAFELWNILQIFGLADQAFGTKSRFAKLFGGKLVEGRGRVPTHWEFDDSPDTPAVVAALNKVSLGRDKLLALKELPPKQYEHIVVELEPEDRARLEEELREAGIDVEEIIAAIERSKENADEVPEFREMSRAREILARAKIPSLVKLASQYEEAGEPIVVFSAHKAPIKVLASRPGWVEMSGDVPTKKRPQIVRDFKAGKYKGIAATIRSSGTGITLTRARTAIFLDQDWTPTKNLQAADRIHRIGQTRQVEIKILVADHAIDQRVAEILEKKRQLIDSTVNAARRMTLTESEINDQPEVDFDALAAKYMAEVEREGERQRERERVREDITKLRETEIEERAEEARVKAETRPSRNAAERFAADAMMTLAALDPDRAKVKNEMGFDGASGSVGHALARQLNRNGELTEDGWRLAKVLAKKFHRQVGKMPTEE